MRTHEWAPALDSWSVSDAASLCLAVVQGVAFWVAVLLPVVYLPLLVATSFTSINPLSVLYLVGLHVVALVAGHRYASARGLTPREQTGREDERDPEPRYCGVSDP